MTIRALLVCSALAPLAVPAATLSLFFPPDPPTLGAPPPAANPADAQRSAAPAELTGYINDSFYAPLASRLTATTTAGQLSNELRTRLAAYRATKVALQTELRAKLYTLREADAATREARLAEFSRDQTPRIVALEQAEEQLRRDLAAGSDLASLVASMADPSGRLRAIAFFDDGPSPGQRRLLREVAAEVSKVTKPGSSGSCLFFSPEGAQVRLPADLPAELVAKIAKYQNDKAALKQALRAIAEKTTSLRGSAWAELDAQQSSQLAALDDLAEDIRRSLALRKDPAQAPDISPLPPELAGRIAAYRRDKNDLQKSLLVKVDEVSKNQPANGAPAELQEKIREAIASYTRENASRYTALDQRRDGIRSDLARMEKTTGGSAPAVSADMLLQKFTDALQQMDIWRNYQDYQVAALQPGLSPPQRRLLFDGALESLALPLPTGRPSP